MYISKELDWETGAVLDTIIIIFTDNWYILRILTHAKLEVCIFWKFINEKKLAPAESVGKSEITIKKNNKIITSQVLKALKGLVHYQANKGLRRS